LNIHAIEISPEVSSILDKMCERLDKTRTQVVEVSITMLMVALAANGQGKQIGAIDPDGQVTPLFSDF
jgi:predicted transcriptional regulator